MKVFTLSTAVTLFAVSAHAAPALNPVQVGARGVFNAPITFYGAAGASYFLSVPTDNSVVYISMSFTIFPPLSSLSHTLIILMPELKNYAM